MEEIVFRQSDVKTYMTCERQAWLGVFRNLTPVGEAKPNTSHTGTAVHRGMEAYYKGGSRADVRTAINTQLDVWVIELGIDTTDPGWTDAINLAQIMMAGYIDWIEQTGLDAGITFDVVERRYKKLVGIFHGVKVYITGQIDIAGTDDLGTKRMYDTKTVGDLKPDPLFQINQQLQTYDWLTDYEYSVFIHNQLRRVKRTAAAKPPFYDRKEVRFNDAQREAFRVQLEGVVSNMAYDYIALDGGASHFAHVPPNPSRDCSWRCPFKEVCPMFNVGDDAEGFIELAYKQKELIVDDEH